MAKETMSVTHLTNINQLNNELKWKDFKIKTPNGQTLTSQDFDLVAIGTPNKDAENGIWI